MIHHRALHQREGCGRNSAVPLSGRLARNRSRKASALVLTLGVILTACGGSSAATGKAATATTGGSGGPSTQGKAASTKIGGSLTISNESGALWTCGFNPFNPSVNFTSFGTVYEPLIFVDSLRSGKTTPWLATSYSWSNGNKTLTFRIRSGVKWTNGQPFSAADVVFTFQLLKKYPALDLNAVWSVLSSVSQKGSNEVVMTFKNAAVPYFYYVADQTPIVPKSVWSKIANPVTYADNHPIGTGSYEIRSCTPENIAYTRNPHYWQPGLPKIAKVNYPAFTSNGPANTALATGQAQWGGQFIPSIKAFYASKSVNYHYWFPPYANVDLFLNQTVAPLNSLAVRRAMAYAIDRRRVSSIGEYGYEPPSNQAGIVTPTFSGWLDKPLLGKYDYHYDPAKAVSILKGAGYKKNGSGTFISPSGKPLSFTVINVGGNSDWVAALQVISQEMGAVGIKLTTRNMSSTTYDNALYRGKYQLAYGAETGGPTPYYELRQLLYSANSAPVGKAAASNYERYSNPATDKLINSYGATTSTAAQHAIVNKLQKVMLADVPVIPVTEAVDWYQYSTKSLAGWVTPNNPYAQPAPYVTPDWGVVLLHLSET